MVAKEGRWLKWRGSCNVKSRLKEDYCTERKRFDRINRRCKRNYARDVQKKLETAVSGEIGRDFWQEIGEFGMANDRKTKIPMEVTDDNGHVLFDAESVLERWEKRLYELV